MPTNPVNIEAAEQTLTYYGRPSGREILTARLGELVESYNLETDRENELLETTKKVGENMLLLNERLWIKAVLSNPLIPMSALASKETLKYLSDSPMTTVRP